MNNFADLNSIFFCVKQKVKDTSLKRKLPSIDMLTDFISTYI